MNKKPKSVTSTAEEVTDNSLDLTLTRGESVTQAMSMLGFTKRSDKDTISKSYVEYTKVFSATTGTTGMITALVKKDAANVEGEVLEGYVLTIQKYVRAIPEDIHNLSWKFGQPEMLSLVETLGGADEAVAHVVNVVCDSCGSTSPEFVKSQDKTLCPTCFNTKGKNS